MAVMLSNTLRFNMLSGNSMPNSPSRANITFTAACEDIPALNKLDESVSVATSLPRRPCTSRMRRILLVESTLMLFFTSRVRVWACESCHARQISRASILPAAARTYKACFCEGQYRSEAHQPGGTMVPRSGHTVSAASARPASIRLYRHSLQRTL